MCLLCVILPMVKIAPIDYPSLPDVEISVQPSRIPGLVILTVEMGDEIGEAAISAPIEPA